MESLPPEVQQIIAGCLNSYDLKALRLVNKRFSNIAARPLFEILNFSGNEQADRYELIGIVANPTPEYHKYPSRKRTVQYTELPEAVAEVLPLAKYVKTFKFSPAFYRERFWQDYRVHLGNRIGAPALSVGYDSDLDEDYEHAERRFIEERLSRIEAAERSWNQKIATQNASANSVANSLVTLFKNMPRLRSIEISQWKFASYDGFEVVSRAVDDNNEHSSQTMNFLNALAQALSSAERGIEELRLPRLVFNDFRDTAALRHVFSGLRCLKMQLWNVGSLREYRPQSLAWVELFKCAQQTLQSLEIAGGIFPYLPDEGSHTLINMLGTEDTGEPRVFPELRTLRVQTLILNTPLLVRFLNCQPKITNLHFGHTYLATPGQGWPFLVKSSPQTVQTWTLSRTVGHEPVLGHDPVAYHWFTQWERESLRETPIGWKYTLSPGSNSTVIEFRRT